MGFRYVGVDPGLQGAIAVCELDANDRPQFSVVDMPTLEVVTKSTGKKHRIVNVAELTAILESVTSGGCYVAVERVQAMPSIPGKDGLRRTMGSSSSFNFGMGFGMVLGVIGALRISHELVHPKKWKGSYDLGGQEKDASRQKVIQLFPYAASLVARKKDDGRADAILLADFARWAAPGALRQKTTELPGQIQLA